MLDDGLVTSTSLDQVALEQRITATYADLAQSGAPVADLLRRQHVQYLHTGLGALPNGFVALDAGRPWICYWVVHALALLDAPFPADLTPGGAPGSCLDSPYCASCARAGWTAPLPADPANHLEPSGAAWLMADRPPVHRLLFQPPPPPTPPARLPSAIARWSACRCVLWPGHAWQVGREKRARALLCRASIHLVAFKRDVSCLQGSPTVNVASSTPCSPPLASLRSRSTHSGAGAANAVLAALPCAARRADVAEFLGLCQCAGGGFGGGPGQLAHLAPTYAAVMALAELGGGAALSVVDRPAAARFLAQRAVPPRCGGGFTLCEGARPRCARPQARWQARETSAAVSW